MIKPTLQTLSVGLLVAFLGGCLSDSEAPIGLSPPDSAIASSCSDAFTAYQPSPVAAQETVLSNQKVIMSDGVAIALDVHLPSGEARALPTIVSITGYGKSGPVATLENDGLVSHGYALVIIDDRGTGNSEGDWASFDARSQADYPELLDWIVAQPWSNGVIGLTGTSYSAITSLFAASSQHPNVKAVFGIVPAGDTYRDNTFSGGQLNTAFTPAWLGLSTALSVAGTSELPQLGSHVLGAADFQLSTLADAALGGDVAYDGAFWRTRSPLEGVDKIRAPTFIVGGLDDLFQRGQPMLYERLARNVDSRLFIGPWAHTSAGKNLPSGRIPTLQNLRLQWMDHYLKGIPTGTECIPKVTQYYRGVDEYRAAARWPVPGLKAQRWYLGADETLALEPPSTDSGSRTYVQIPLTGLCTRSLNQWLGRGSFDAAPCTTNNQLDEAGPLTLEYTSQPFETAMTVNGPIQADVWIVTDSSEAMVSVAVSDVAPDGSSRGLSNGLLSATHRATDNSRSRYLDGQSIQPWHPFTREAVTEVARGEPMLLSVEVFPTSFVILPGHSLRVTLAPYDVPHAMPPVEGILNSLVGIVEVLSDRSHPTSIVLPVEPAFR